MPFTIPPSPEAIPLLHRLHVALSLPHVLRAAGDSGAIDVFKSVWYLPPPRALNWMVREAWGGPTLVLQVMGGGCRR